jgi:hypothetical protein
MSIFFSVPRIRADVCRGACSCFLPTSTSSTSCWECVAPYRQPLFSLSRAQSDARTSAYGLVTHQVPTLADACRIRCEQQLQPGSHRGHLGAQTFGLLCPQSQHIHRAWHTALEEHQLREFASHESPESPGHCCSRGNSRWSRHVTRIHSGGLCGERGTSGRNPHQRPHSCWSVCTRRQRWRCGTTQARAGPERKVVTKRAQPTTFAIAAPTERPRIEDGWRICASSPFQLLHWPGRTEDQSMHDRQRSTGGARRVCLRPRSRHQIRSAHSSPWAHRTTSTQATHRFHYALAEGKEFRCFQAAFPVAQCKQQNNLP